MRILGVAVLALVSCSAGPGTTSRTPSEDEALPAETTDDQVVPAERLTADTAKTTVAGHTFTAPAGWSVTVRGRATIVTAPEGDSHMAFVDVQAQDAAEAVEAAWTEYGLAEIPPLAVAEGGADKNGWTDIHSFEYQVPPNDKRVLFAEARRVKDAWLVVLADMSNVVAEKRFAPIQLMLDGLFAKGYTPESFAGKTANRLDDARVAELAKFIETAQTQLEIPGVSLGIVQDGKVVFVGGFGERERGKPTKVDGDTKFRIASNTKALTTLMLAKLVDDKRISWDSPATDLLPSFRLGDPETTKRVEVEHLVCACTGLPRQDLEWEFEYGQLTPQKLIDLLSTTQPTSDFGELFQYSNTLAAAAGFIGGHVLFPKLELGKAYDRAMRSRVLGPLGMKSTTFDRKRAQRGNWARPHVTDIDGKTVIVPQSREDPTAPLRPAGGAWSTARDLLAYVQMELAEGQLPDGGRYISKDALLARRAPRVPIGKDATYGMGLGVETKHDVTLVFHGGALPGYKSDMVWLPQHGTGAVILTNGNSGWVLLGSFRRKLLEVLFDGKPQADAEVAAATKNWNERVAAERKMLDLPADLDLTTKLAPTYDNPALGELTVRRATGTNGTTVFDFGEWKSEVGSRKHPDGTVSLVTIAPGVGWFEFVPGNDGVKRTLTVRDEQHEYVFVER